MSKRRLHRQVRLDKAMGRRQRRQSKRRNGCASNTHTAGREGCEDSRRQRATLGPAARSVAVCPARPDEKRFLCASRCLPRPPMSGLTRLILVLQEMSCAVNQRFQSENCELSLSQDSFTNPKRLETVLWTVCLWRGSYRDNPLNSPDVRLRRF